VDVTTVSEAVARLLAAGGVKELGEAACGELMAGILARVRAVFGSDARSVGALEQARRQGTETAVTELAAALGWYARRDAEFGRQLAGWVAQAGAGGVAHSVAPGAIEEQAMHAEAIQRAPEVEQFHSGLHDPRGGSAPAPDPPLEGIRYDELRYDDPSYDDEPSYGGFGDDQPLDDVSWYEELRRNAPAYPERPSGQPTGGQRRGDLRGPGYGQQPGYGSQPRSGLAGGYPQAFGDGQGEDDRGGSGPPTPQGPRISVGPETGPHAPALPQVRDGKSESIPGEAPPESTLAAPSAAPGISLAPAVRPGHGLDGPEITESWPDEPQGGDREAFEDFWQEGDEEYRGLFAEETRRRPTYSEAAARRFTKVVGILGRGRHRRRPRGSVPQANLTPADVPQDGGPRVRAGKPQGMPGQATPETTTSAKDRAWGAYCPVRAS